LLEAGPLEPGDYARLSRSPESPESVVEKKPLEVPVFDVMGGSARREVKIHEHGLVALLDVTPRLHTTDDVTNGT
jgi:hypothetical protein